MLNRFKQISSALALTLYCGTLAGAQVIQADTIGEDNLADPRYYGVDFLSGGPAGNTLA